ncbi:metallophosphoesterase, partial [Enterococcus faecalis]
MKVCFWSDLHLGHANITKFRPIFSTMEEHDEFIMDTIISMKDKRTVFYILGDAFVSRDGLEKFEKLFSNVRTTLVLGNHDLERERLSFKDLVGVVDNVQSLVKY